MEGKEGKELRKKEVGRGGKEEDEERKEVKRGRIVRKKEDDVAGRRHEFVFSLLQWAPLWRTTW